MVWAYFLECPTDFLLDMTDSSPTSYIPAEPHGLAFNDNGIHIFPAEDDAAESRIFRPQFNEVLVQIDMLQGSFFSDPHSSNLAVLYLRLAANCHQITVVDAGLHAVALAGQRKGGVPAGRHTNHLLYIFFRRDGRPAGDPAYQRHPVHLRHRLEARRNRAGGRSSGRIIHNCTFGDAEIICHLLYSTHARNFRSEFPCGHRFVTDACNLAKFSL
nr:MAG TPA: hypothetical protein [Caudoviricetes sp.]